MHPDDMVLFNVTRDYLRISRLSPEKLTDAHERRLEECVETLRGRRALRLMQMISSPSHCSDIGNLLLRI